MNLANRIHEHLHSSQENQKHPTPFWIRHYDGLVRFVSLGRVGTLHGGTLALAQFEADQALLDIGCGTGEFLLRAESEVEGQGTFVGLDVEPGMIAQANGKAAAAQSAAVFAKASIDSIPYSDNSFDVITSSLMFHHLEPEQQTAGLAEVWRVLKPDGRLIVVDINTARRSLVSRFPGHRHLEQGDPVQHEVSGLLRQTGFINVSVGTHPLKALSYALGTKP